MLFFDDSSESFINLETTTIDISDLFCDEDGNIHFYIVDEDGDFL